MDLQTLKTRSDGRELGQDSRRKPDGLMVIKRPVVGSGTECREPGKLEITIMHTSQDGGEEKVRKKIKNILIAVTSDV